MPGKKKPTRLKDFSEDVQKKARDRVARMNLDKVLWSETERLPAIPTKKETVRVAKRTLPARGGNYWDDGAPGFDAYKFLDTFNKTMKVLKKKGAERISVVHGGLRLLGTRHETDAEFQKRVTEAEEERAVVLAIRERKETAAQEIEERRLKSQKKRNNARFRSVMHLLTDEEIEELLKERKSQPSSS